MTRDELVFAGARLLGLILIVEVVARVVAALFHPLLYELGSFDHELLSQVPVLLGTGLPGVLLFFGAPHLDRWLRAKDQRSAG